MPETLAVKIRLLKEIKKRQNECALIVKKNDVLKLFLGVLKK